jgi:hypothetical protein
LGRPPLIGKTTINREDHNYIGKTTANYREDHKCIYILLGRPPLTGKTTTNREDHY